LVIPLQAAARAPGRKGAVSLFETLTNTLQGFFGKIRGRARLSEQNIRDGLREVRMALLEADVHYQVVKKFIDDVTARAVGEDVIRGVNPAQQIVKIVHDELEALMGPVDNRIPLKGDGPTVIMLVGLQGSGKTTTCGKLALYLKEREHCSPIMAAADVQRPAAIDQLEIVGGQIGVPVVAERGADALTVCMKARLQAYQQGRNPLIMDTGGRLHIDEQMMEELREIKRTVSPDQIYFVADARTGQDAVVSAQEFNRQLEFDGVILTNLDGDARGGAAISIKTVTGKPIKFVGTGEKVDKFEPFHPDRMADRILGMGDVVSLVEKAQEVIAEEDAKLLEEKLMKASFDLEDFRKQLGMIKKMGPLRDILSFLPFVGNKLDDLEFDEKQLDGVESIINSMTHDERRHPEMIGASRRARIARGSGHEPVEVNRLLKQFREMKKVMRKLTRGGVDTLAEMMPEGLDIPGGPTPKGMTPRHSFKKGRKRRRR
jgi:signal recognition particle subunit SRP54